MIFELILLIAILILQRIKLPLLYDDLEFGLTLNQICFSMDNKTEFFEYDYVILKLKTLPELNTVLYKLMKIQFIIKMIVMNLHFLRNN